MNDALPPGSTIGILGGGQLGRMLALAAARLGLRCHIYTPEDDSPAAEVSAAVTVAAYDDEAALARFAAAVDRITYEFENVPAATAGFLAPLRPLHPSAGVLSTTQDRLVEKRFVAGLGLGTAPFEPVDDLASLDAALARLGTPAILKTRRLGYDGKGQAMIRDRSDAEAAWRAVGGAPSILEGFVAFTREVSVVATRGRDGTLACYDLVENEHRDHILHVSRVPARVPVAVEADARRIATRIAEGLDYVGTFCVELFQVGGETPALLVNEIAPRVHNSGHWTLDACTVSQFENHVRAVAGWPLGATRRHSDALMTNLIGSEIETWRALAAEAGAAFHAYGKAEPRPGRKMGHVTRVAPRRGA